LLIAAEQEIGFHTVQRFVQLCKRKFYAGLCKRLVIKKIFYNKEKSSTKVEKIAPKNKRIYQELKGLSGTFASLKNRV
jgi:cyclophilin family peptidyl-prolyl cis-trans isomerase